MRLTYTWLEINVKRLHDVKKKKIKSLVMSALASKYVFQLHSFAFFNSEIFRDILNLRSKF